jgi:hypothetical protein
VEYLRAKVERGDGGTTMAAAHALGATIGRRSRAQGGAVDERSAELLRRGLAEATSPKDKADWLATIGNAALTEDVPLVSGYAADGDPGVRQAVADALRRTQTPASEAVLLGLAADPHRGVQDRALHALTGYTLSSTHLDALQQQVSTGKLGPKGFAMLMTLLERNRAQPDAVLPVLEAMLAQDVGERRLLLRIRALRETLSSGR